MRGGRIVWQLCQSIPTLVLLVWASFFVYGYASKFSEPLNGVSFEYESRSGKVWVYAEHAQIDLLSGKIVAEGIKVRDSEKQLVATVKSADLYFPAAWTLQSGVRVNLGGAHINVSRQEGGNWNLEDLLPKPKEKPTAELPFSVNADRVEISLTDQLPGFVGQWEIAATNLMVAGRGKSALANFDFVVGGAGTGSAELSFEPNGHRGRVKTAGIELGRVLRHLKATRELGGVDWINRLEFDQGHFAGNADWEQFDGKPFRIEGNGVASATHLKAFDIVAAAARFAGTFNEAAAQGDLQATVDGVKVDVNGVTRYSPKFSVTATGTVKADRYADLRTRFKLPSLPEGVTASRMAFDGSMSYSDNLVLAGKATIGAASYNTHKFENLIADVGVNPEGFKVWGLRGTTYGGALSGEFAGIRDAVSGRFELKGASRLPIPEEFSSRFIPRKTDAKALVRGTLKRVEVVADVEGSGTAVIELGGEPVRDEVGYVARLSWLDGKLKVSSAAVNGATGMVVGQGEFDASSGKVVAQGNLRSIDFSKLGIGGVSGIGFAQFNLSGDLDNPIVSGRVEAYNAAYEEYSIPLSSASFELKKQELDLNDLILSSGASTAKGKLNVIFEKEVLFNGSGTLHDVALSSYVDQRVQGLVDGQWWLVGTKEDPQLKTSLDGANIIVDKLAVDNASASLSVSKSGIAVSEAQAKIGSGSAQVFGTLQDGVGNFHFLSENLPLNAFSEYFGQTAVPGGQAGLTGDITTTKGQVTKGNVEATVRNFTINGEVVGSGTATITGEGDDFFANAQLGSLDGYLLLENGKFNRTTRLAEGTISVLDANIAAARRLASNWLNDHVSGEVRANLNSVEGSISMGAILSGSIDDPNVDFSFQTKELQYAGKPIGDAVAKAVRTAAVWTISEAQLTGGPATLRLSKDAQNRIDENGPISLDGEINNIDLSWLASFSPEIGDLRGTVDIPFTVSGDSSSPTIFATLSGKNLAWGEFVADAFEFGPFEAREGQIVAEQGGMQVRGLSLNLVSARIPFRYPFSFPSTEPLEVQFSVPETDIKTLSRFFGELDTEISEGKLSGGRFKVTGTPSDWHANGEAKLEAPRLKFSTVATVFDDVALSAKLADTTLSVQADARGEAGGTILLQAELDAESKKWLPTSKLLVEDFALQHKFENGSYLRGVTFANLSFSGDLLTPVVTGTAAFDEALFDVRGEFTSSAAPGVIAFNPQFDIELGAKRGEVRNGLMKVRANGSGKLAGTLDSPVVDVGFRVIDGDVQLLSGPLKIEQGSVAHLSHRPVGLGATETRLPIDLRARTSLTSVTEANVQRYDVTLYITGDLFSKEGLDFDVLSDPPGLTKDDFVGIVGQKQLFASETGFGGNFQDRLKDILSVVSPVFLTPITSQLEKAFGLDYIVLNFGSGSLGGIIFGKTLGKGFSLEYRQPLNEDSTLNQLDQLTLTYRPPVKNPLVSRLTLGVGLNREGEASFSLTYSNRFRSGKAKRK